MKSTTIQMQSLLLAGLLGWSVSHSAYAQDGKIGAISVDNPYTRATVAGQVAAGGFMRIVNTGAADQLISVSSPVSTEVQLHTMKMDGNVMQMREVKRIDLPANGAVELKPGGLHLMFINIKEPLKVGDFVPVKLKFTKAGEVEIKMPVKAMGGNHQGTRH